MKSRKFAAALVALSLLIGVAGTAAAAPGDTVPGAVYSPHWGGTPPGEAKGLDTVKEELVKAGIADVQPTDWFAGSVTVLLQAGLMAPDANGNLNPTSPVGAAEGVAIFAKVLGIASALDDNATAVQKAQQVGLASDGEVTGDMSRMQVARLLAKALGVSPKQGSFPFTDGEGLSADDQGILAALYELGVFKGYPDHTFKPGNILTKAEIAILIDRVLGATR